MNVRAESHAVRKWGVDSFDCVCCAEYTLYRPALSMIPSLTSTGSCVLMLNIHGVLLISELLLCGCCVYVVYTTETN